MTGSRDKFHDDGELDQLAHDLDLDMDAPIGATFAAALRDKGGDVATADDEGFNLDDDGFVTPHPRQAGEVEMPGWIYHLEPRGNRLIGLGYDQGNPEGSITVSTSGSS